ncbi:hypothetical protein ACG904_21005, partial [Acinetobacter guillouiae]|uniref:hypothetical protein n=1 Tax=Acinetobacter guillouiae TaxID=106649 RepID=UPI003AF8563C
KYTRPMACTCTPGADSWDRPWLQGDTATAPDRRQLRRQTFLSNRQTTCAITLNKFCGCEWGRLWIHWRSDAIFQKLGIQQGTG